MTTVGELLKGGRPTKRTDETMTALVRALSIGVTRRAACALAGIGKTVFYEWMADPAFADIVEQAEASAEEKWIRQASKHSASAVKLLERRFRTDWGEKITVGLEGNDKKPIVLGVRPVDIRDIVAPLTTRPEPDSDAPGQDEVSGDGTQVGKDDPGGHG